MGCRYIDVDAATVWARARGNGERGFRDSKSSDGKHRGDTKEVCGPGKRLAGERPWWVDGEHAVEAKVWCWD